MWQKYWLEFFLQNHDDLLAMKINTDDMTFVSGTHQYIFHTTKSTYPDKIPCLVRKNLRHGLSPIFEKIV